MTPEQLSRLQTVASVPSRSDARKYYTVKTDPETGLMSCDCPGWIYSKREPRSCRHTILFESIAKTLMDPKAVVNPTKPYRGLTQDAVDLRNQIELGSTRPSGIGPEVIEPGTSRRSSATARASATPRSRTATRSSSGPATTSSSSSTRPDPEPVRKRVRELSIRSISFDIEE